MIFAVIIKSNITFVRAVRHPLYESSLIFNREKKKNCNQMENDKAITFTYIEWLFVRAVACLCVDNQ